MSIHFISGKPGGGKSLYGVRLIVDELVKGNRPIVTNVPLKLARLNEYLDERYGRFVREFKMASAVAAGDGIGKPLDTEEKFWAAQQAAHLTARVVLIDEDDLSKFFTFRGGGVRLESINNSRWKMGERPDYGRIRDGGVLYVLDEVHIAFNSRAWAETGSEVLYYLSQHRKLGDDVVCITQSVGNVDKQFRSVAQDYTYIRNPAKQKAGIFRLPAVFIRQTYAQPATENSVAMESGTFTLDVSGLASCYDTAKGVGIHGRSGADTNARRRGVHWMWFVVGFPLFLAALFHFVPKGVVALLSPDRSTHRVFGGLSSNAVAVASGVPVGASPASATPAGTVPPSASHIESADGSTNEFYCTGFCMLNRNSGVVFFSDGTSVETESGRLSRIEKRFVVLDGVRVPIRKGVSYLSNTGAPSWSVESRNVEPLLVQPVANRPMLGGVVVAPTVGASRRNLSSVQQ